MSAREPTLKKIIKRNKTQVAADHPFHSDLSKSSTLPDPSLLLAPALQLFYWSLFFPSLGCLCHALKEISFFDYSVFSSLLGCWLVALSRCVLCHKLILLAYTLIHVLIWEASSVFRSAKLRQRYQSLVVQLRFLVEHVID